MGFSNFLAANGQPPRQSPQLQNWLVSLLGLLEGVPGIKYQEYAGGPTIPNSLDALYPEGADNGIVVWNNTSLTTITLYFNFSGTWVVGPSTAAGAGSGDAIPPGTIVPYGGTAAYAASLSPDWLICYGQAVSRTTYADLWAAMGTTHGSGDGSTTFNLPDLRGRVIAGNDNMGGSSANVVTDTSADSVGGEFGEEKHTLLETELPAHRHEIRHAWYLVDDDPMHDFGSGRLAQYFASNNGLNMYAAHYTSATQVEGTSGFVGIEETGSDTPHNVIQPSTFMHYLVKT